MYPQLRALSIYHESPLLVLVSDGDGSMVSLYCVAFYSPYLYYGGRCHWRCASYPSFNSFSLNALAGGLGDH